jgi:hypothetical protein
VDVTLKTNGAYSDLLNPVHQMITVGTPHQGSQFANLLVLNAPALIVRPTPWLAAAIAFGEDPSLWGANTLGSFMNILGDNITAGAVSSFSVNSGSLLQLNSPADGSPSFPFRDIVGVAPPDTGAGELLFGTETQLNLALALAGVPATVNSTLTPGPYDTIVTSTSQGYLVAGASSLNDLATIDDVVHTPILEITDTGETQSPAVWNQILYWLAGGQGQFISDLRHASGVPTKQLSGKRGVASPKTVPGQTGPAPILDLTGYTQVDASNVTITPATQSALPVGALTTISALPKQSVSFCWYRLS